MNIQRLAMILTLINLIILIFVLTSVPPASAQGVTPVLRGRALEIVDDQGRVRAWVGTLPATTMPDGQKYPETILFRLIDTNGRPAVKIGGSVDGSGMSLEGDSERREWGGVQILAQGAGTTLKLTNQDGTEKLVIP
jgi:hypothetical protein